MKAYGDMYACTPKAPLTNMAYLFSSLTVLGLLPDHSTLTPPSETGDEEMRDSGGRIYSESSC